MSTAFGSVLRYQPFGNLCRRMFSSSCNYVNSIHFESLSSIMCIEKGRKTTYGEFERKIKQWSAVLRNHGVGKGSIVAAQIDKRIDVLFLVNAVYNLGAIYVPMNTAYSIGEVNHILTDCQPLLFIHDDQNQTKMALKIPNHESKVLDFYFLMRSVEDSDTWENTEFCTTDDTAMIMYTSGTTGKPKGAMMSHGNLVSNGKALADLWRFDKQDTLLHILPLYHVHGLLVAVSTVFFSGAAMRLLPKFDPVHVVDGLKGSTVLMGVPTHYNRLLNCSEFTKSNTSGMRLFTCGSAPLRPATFHQIQARVGQAPLERYGMTEAQMITSNPYEGPRIAGTVGKPLPGYDVRVVDHVVQCKGPGVFRGYIGAPEKTRESFTADGYFITGDIGEIDPGSGHLIIKSRLSDMIISGGLNIYPKEIETVIDGIEGVLESAVVGVPDPDFGEVPLALVHCTSDANLTSDAVKQHVKTKIAGFKVPKLIVFTKDGLPKNSMGKVQKKQIRDDYGKSKDL